jgi:hypothetical protein
MSQDRMPYNDDPLWLKIDAFSIDRPDSTVPFSSKLAAEQNWSADFTTRAIEEYKRFIFLCCVSPKGAAPSPVIDEVWHLHLTYTVDYWQRFCRDTIGKEIHHHPSTGGHEQNKRHQEWYSETLRLYEDTFQTAAPLDIWEVTPASKIIVLPEDLVGAAYFLSKGGVLPYVLFLIPFLVILMLYGNINPFALSGPHFLIFYFLLIVAVTVSTVYLARMQRNALIPLLSPLLKYAAVYDPSKLADLNGREFQSMLSTLTGEGLLTPASAEAEQHHAVYSISQQKLLGSTHPMASALKGHGSRPVDQADLLAYASRAFENGKKKVDELRSAFDNWYNLGILPGVLLGIGGLRLAQGFINEKPITYLVVLVVIQAFLLKIIVTASNFSNTGKALMQTNRFVTEKDKREYLNGFMALGFAGILSSRNWFNANATDNTSGGSSCGSSGCGSSCGGGCGGCSGGD